MVTRLTINFTPEERKALQRMSETDFRPLKDQVRWLLHEEAKRRGLLQTANRHTQSQTNSEGGDA
jgi:hypothetical protein